MIQNKFKLHPVVIINMLLLHRVNAHKTEITGKQTRRLCGHNIFTSTQAYYIIQISLSALENFSSSLSNNHLVWKHSSARPLVGAHAPQHEPHLQWTPCQSSLFHQSRGCAWFYCLKNTKIREETWVTSMLISSLFVSNHNNDHCQVIWYLLKWMIHALTM